MLTRWREPLVVDKYKYHSFFHSHSFDQLTDTGGAVLGKRRHSLG
jgi:hypothetical protein